MSWAVGYDDNWQRDIGYGVPSICDHPGCKAKIDRGLSYVCGTEPKGGEHGCGLYFCTDHLRTAGDHRDNAQLCTRCYWRNRTPFTPTPDVIEWIQWKLDDESWAQWRQKNPDEVQKLIAALAHGTEKF